jgi:hypothetical protein
MSLSAVPGPLNANESPLPRRDLVILPLLSLLTIGALLLVTEFTARHFFFSQFRNTCIVDDDGIGFRYRPDCKVALKTAEGPWVTNEYNACGYRTKEPCGSVSPGSIRIVLLGASVSEGLFIPYDDTFAARTARGLTETLGRPVEVQNLGRINASPISVFRQLKEALALNPRLVIMVVDPYDIEHVDPARVPDRYKPISPGRDASTVPIGALKKLVTLMKESATATASAHFLFQDSATYARLYLHYGDHADYLRQPLSPAWEKRLAGFEVLIAEMASETNAQHVPFVLVQVPSEAQAALVKMQPLPAGVDPDLLSSRLAQITSRHGVQLINTLDAFRHGPAPNRTFYVVDTHLNAEGQWLVSRVLLEELLKYRRSALLGADESQLQVAKEQGR